MEDNFGCYVMIVIMKNSIISFSKHVFSKETIKKKEYIGTIIIIFEIGANNNIIIFLL